MLQSSGDLRAVQELLGHANITTTQVYTRLDFQHLAKIYDATHPRALAGSKAGAGPTAARLPLGVAVGAEAGVKTKTKAKAKVKAVSKSAAVTKS